MKIDFSIFHDLMHMPFSKYCRSLHPGGWRAGIHHLKMDWQLRRYDQLRSPWRKLVLCKVGRHEMVVWYHRHDDVVDVLPKCKFCQFERPPTDEELAVDPPFMPR